MGNGRRDDAATEDEDAARDARRAAAESMAHDGRYVPLRASRSARLAWWVHNTYLRSLPSKVVISAYHQLAKLPSSNWKRTWPQNSSQLFQPLIDLKFPPRSPNCNGTPPPPARVTSTPPVPCANHLLPRGGGRRVDAVVAPEDSLVASGSPAMQR